MAGRKVFAFALLAVLLAAGHLGPVGCQPAVPSAVPPAVPPGLSPTFYAKSCPNVDQIVRDSVGASMNSSAIVGPGVLRLFAHDCFVTGCDGSILLQDTSPTSHVERDYSDNLTLQQLAFDAITSAKTAVEAQCPGVVSCSDILVMAAEDVVGMMGGPSWTVQLGRRDGLNSTEASVVGHLPGAEMDVTQLMGIFGSVGLTSRDLVVLSGAHTVGFAHCASFLPRLYNFNNVTNATDPSLAPSYATTLKALCPQNNSTNSSVQALDPTTPGVFDNDYYQKLQVGDGLLLSDQTLFVDNTTTNMVTTYANNQPQFFTDFIASMLAMSQIQVITGTKGEIRLNCSVVNSGIAVPGNGTAPPANVTAPPPRANATTPPPTTVVTPSPPPTPVVTASPPPAPVVTASPPPAPVVKSSPPPAPVVTASPPPAPVVKSSPPPVPVVTPSPPPAPVVVPSPPPPVVTASPPPAPVVTPSPPLVPASPPPASITPSPKPKASAPPPPLIPENPPTVGRRRA